MDVFGNAVLWTKSIELALDHQSSRASVDSVKIIGKGIPHLFGFHFPLISPLPINDTQH